MRIVVIEGFPPYDGRYEFDETQINTQESGWIKRLTGYLPAEYENAAEGEDPEIVCALAAIALHRAGKITPQEVRTIYERLILVPIPQLAEMIGDEPVEVEEDDAGPPPRRSNGSESTSGESSKISSETSVLPPKLSGTPDSDTSASESETWAY